MKLLRERRLFHGVLHGGPRQAWEPHGTSGSLAGDPIVPIRLF